MSCILENCKDEMSILEGIFCSNLKHVIITYKLHHASSVVSNRVLTYTCPLCKLIPRLGGFLNQ